MLFKDFKAEISPNIDKFEFEAYAAIKNVWDDSNENIRDGAFSKTLMERLPKNLIKVFWWHREPMGLPIVVKEDSKGLYTYSKVSRTDSNKEHMILMADGVVDRMSIGYNTIKYNQVEEGRELLEVKLYEYSPVPIAMCEETAVLSVKSIDDLFGKFSSLMDKIEYRSVGAINLKPYPNEHSARIKDPGAFDEDTFRRKSDGTIYGSIKVPATADVIWGKLKGASKPADMPIPQAIRFPIEDWTEKEAKDWLKENNVKYIKFEPASKEAKEGRIISASNRKKLIAAVNVLQEILELSDADREKEISAIADIIEDMRNFRVSLK